MKTKNEVIKYLKEHKDKYKKEYNFIKLGLFGSTARGDNSNSSDIDILYEIDQNSDFSIFSYLSLISEIERDLDTKVDLVREATIKEDLKKYIDKDLIYV